MRNIRALSLDRQDSVTYVCRPGPVDCVRIQRRGVYDSLIENTWYRHTSLHAALRSCLPQYYRAV